MRRRFLLLFVIGMGILGMAVACNSADFTPATPKDCRKVQCDCEEDPNQPTCKGFTGPEGGLDGGLIPDTSDFDAGNDAGTDATDDAADGADAADQ
jgi:hypothetical protein